MRLVKRLIELALVILVISLFMKNKDVELQLNYFGLSQPLKVAFWELVTFCVSLGIIIAAVGDFVTQFKWVRERRRMMKTDQEHHSEVAKLEGKIGELESENRRLNTELEQKTAQIVSLQRSEAPSLPPGPLPSLKPEDTK